MSLREIMQRAYNAWQAFERRTDVQLAIPDGCISCQEGSDRSVCPNSPKSCGHHCNHSWSHDTCCWCETQWATEEEKEEHMKTELDREWEAWYASLDTVGNPREV